MEHVRTDVELKGDLLTIRLSKKVIEAEEALDIQERVWSIFEGEARPLKVLIDLARTENAETRAKRILSDTIRHDNALVARTALVFPTHVVKARARIVYLMGQRKDVESFSDEEKALEWLHAGP